MPTTVEDLRAALRAANGKPIPYTGEGLTFSGGIVAVSPAPARPRPMPTGAKASASVPAPAPRQMSDAEFLAGLGNTVFAARAARVAQAKGQPKPKTPEPIMSFTALSQIVYAERNRRHGR